MWKKKRNVPVISTGEVLLTFWLWSGPKHVCENTINLSLRQTLKMQLQIKINKNSEYVRTSNWDTDVEERKCSFYYCSLHKWMLAAYSIEILGNYSVTCWDAIWSHLPWKTGQNLLFITLYNCRPGRITEMGEIAEIPILKRKYSCTSCTDHRFRVTSSKHVDILPTYWHLRHH